MKATYFHLELDGKPICEHEWAMDGICERKKSEMKALVNETLRFEPGRCKIVLGECPAYLKKYPNNKD